MSTQLINRTERLATIERLLFRNVSGMRVVEIAENCDVDRRTVYRDLALLREIGVPIYQKDGRYYLNHEQYVATVRLNIFELVALYVASRGLVFYVEQQNPHVISALKKLGKALPEPLARHVNTMVETVRATPVDRAFVSVLETMTRAWALERKVKLWYRRPIDPAVCSGDFAVNFIEPSSNGGLYAVAYDFSARRVVSLRLEWIARAQLLTEHYYDSEQFERQPYLAGAWGIMQRGIDEPLVDVTLSFVPEMVPMVKERLGQDARRITMTDDGRYVIRMQVADWREMLPWIRAWGTKVEVLGPSAFREAVAAEVKHLAALYARPASVS